MLARVLAVIVCLSVCVCLSHAGIVSKRLNVGSRKQHRVIAIQLTHNEQDQTKLRFDRLLRSPAWKWSGTILVEREGMDEKRK